MSSRFLAAILLLTGTHASAHRLDEYLQGTIISVDKNRLLAEMSLTPGVAIFPYLITSIDTNGDGTISETEQRAYAARVLHDLSVTIDGHRLTPHALSMHFPTVAEMKSGMGAIRLEFTADLPRGGGRRRLTLDNHHQSGISAYQVNVLVPKDPDIQIATQDRNYSQSSYRLEYVQAGAIPNSSLFPSWPELGWLGTIAVLLFARPIFLWRKRVA